MAKRVEYQADVKHYSTTELGRTKLRLDSVVGQSAVNGHGAKNSVAVPIIGIRIVNKHRRHVARFWRGRAAFEPHACLSHRVCMCSIQDPRPHFADLLLAP
jgi:hypothetical protein